MKALTEKILHYLLLVVVTIIAVWVMWKISSKQEVAEEENAPRLRSLPAVVAPKAAVAIQALPLEICEITSTFAGKIRPWETYQLAFEVPGRVLELGKNELGQPLDDGDRVAKGQVLALLNDRVFRARRSESSARVEQASSDLQRAHRIRESNPNAISDAEVQSLVTDLATARAQHEVASKNVEDATLCAPVDATISQRFLKAGESVGAHQVVLELVENHDVLLVVDVPESQIRELEQRMRTVQKNRLAESHTGDSDPRQHVFRAHVHLEGKDRFGKPWPQLEGEVYRIAEIADARTGLFEVEVHLANEDRMLRPGMVARAALVTALLPGYRVPESAVIFRGRKTYLFSVTKESTDMEMLYWDLGPADLYRARHIDLRQWVDQGEYIVVPAEETQLSSVIVRGHSRLADNQLVRIVNLEALSPRESPADASTMRVDIATEP